MLEGASLEGTWARVRSIGDKLLMVLAVMALVVSPLPYAQLTPPAQAAEIPDTSTVTRLDAGAYIIDMGVVPQTENNSLRPYGLIYELMIAERIPVIWVINDSKTTGGIDFSYDGKAYSGGAFIIAAEYAAQGAPIIGRWVADYPGLTVDGPTASPIDVPVFDTLTNWPNAILDDQNGSIAEAYYENAGIPETITAGDGTTKTAYLFKDPQTLGACDDLFVMPHADPEWDTHSNLVPWNDQGGFIWAACHAVSVLENVVNPGDPDPDPDMNFLSTNGLLPFGDHDDGTPPYTWATTRGGDPVLQFLGTIDSATENGSEQIYLPDDGSAWRPSTTILAWDPDQADLLSEGGVSPGEASILLYGRAFGDDTNGLVMYESGHSHDKGSSSDIAAQRAFLNFNLMTGIDRGISVAVDAPETIISGEPVPVTAEISGGHPAYTYDWASSCGGTFAPASGVLNDPGTLETMFTAPPGATACTIRVIADDLCSRFSFAADGVQIVEQADMSISKTDGQTGVEEGTAFDYTLDIANAGPSVASNVVVVDPLPAGLSYVTATPTQGSCRFDGTDVICDLGDV
ncbi:MAG: DUF11 domain-containing protein, partial [Acidimicrobiia bacterium]|nr:DUF11 domain-containing protein [Acidimicrobiia bacterium]